MKRRSKKNLIEVLMEERKEIAALREWIAGIEGEGEEGGGERLKRRRLEEEDEGKEDEDRERRSERDGKKARTKRLS